MKKDVTLKLRKCFKFSSMVVPARGRGTRAGNIKRQTQEVFNCKGVSPSSRYGFLWSVLDKRVGCEEG